MPFPKLDKNASDKEAIFGSSSVPPREHFNTENRIQFCKDYSVNRYVMSIETMGPSHCPLNPKTAIINPFSNPNAHAHTRARTHTHV